MRAMAILRQQRLALRCGSWGFAAHQDVSLLTDRMRSFVFNKSGVASPKSSSRPLRRDTESAFAKEDPRISRMEVNAMKTIALLLIVVLALNSNGFAFPTSAPSAGSQTQTGEAKRTAKAKAEVQRRGVGEQSRVRVTLHNGTEVKGYISKVEENSFDVTDRKSGKVVAISYQDVNKVKGPGLSKAAQIVICVGVAIGIVVGIVIAVTPST